MRIRVHHDLDDLEADFRTIARRAPQEFRGVVRDGLRAGNMLAKESARETAGRHGKHYHRAFTTEMRKPYASVDSIVHSGEYGPDISRPQGGMSFERGSRNQKPHLDLARSADLVGPALAGEVRRLPDRWFW